MRKIRLRTKFLLSLLAISAGLTTATLLIVRYSVQQQVRASIREDLGNSLRTYQSFDRQRQVSLSRSAELLANLPNVRALMSTQDAATIQDASTDIWRLSGSDLLVLAGRSGNVVALRTGNADLRPDLAEDFLRGSLEREDRRSWWFGSGHLYEVRVQPVYFGAPSQGTTLGFLAVGYEINERAAEDFSDIAASQVAFQSGDTLVASTLTTAQGMEWMQQMSSSVTPSSGVEHEVQLGGERYLATTVSLSPGGGVPVSLSVLKSFDKASAFLNRLNRVLLALGCLSILAGSLLVFLISHTFTRPLENLVGGVRALAQGDFRYPLVNTGGDEIAQVTVAFETMRSSLQKSQEDHKLMEERLRQSHKMEAVGRLAGGVAHDFNNLLTIIRGHSDLLLDREGADDGYRRSLQQIQKAADRAVSMTRQLLAFSRMQVLQPRLLDLNAIVVDMGKMLSRLIGEHIEYSFLPEPNLPPVKADPGQMEQVIMNLAVNARDAMPGGGKLTVSTRNIVLTEAETYQRPPMSPGRYVLLSVADTGQGMNDEIKARIFDPFFTTKEVGKGTGLGLATVYGVVKQSGGFIWVDSAPGKGATFGIYLPPAAGRISAVETETSPSVVPRGSGTILLVEDEDGVRELACKFLKASGYAVMEAKDGVEALQVAAQYRGTIHLVLSDMVMPRMGGAALAKQLRAERPDTKVLLMSGYSEYTGGKDPNLAETVVLQKPFSMSSLVSKVREVLAAQSAIESSTVNESCVT